MQLRIIVNSNNRFVQTAENKSILHSEENGYLILRCSDVVQFTDIQFLLVFRADSDFTYCD